MNDRSTSSRRRARPSRAKIAIVVAAVALAGYGAYKYFVGGEDGPEYIYATVNVGNIEDLVTATGTLEPRDTVDVGAQVSGQIERILVEVGDQVTAGQVLAEIDATTATARVEANRASLRAQESNLVDRYNTLEKAERDYERQKNLQAAGASTSEQLLNAETTLKSARQAIESLKLQIEQQKASMRVEEANLQYTTIKAPIDGTVVSIAAKQGQTINATQSAPTILTIADLSTMTVRAEVSEADISKISDGMRAYFTTLNGNRQWEGTLKRTEPTPKVQNAVVLYYALFDVQNEKFGNSNTLQLKPGMTAQVFFVNAEARNVLVMPMAALQQGQQIMRERNAAEGGRGDGAPRGNADGAAPAGATAGSAPPAGAAMAQNGTAAGADAPAAAPGAGAGAGNPGEGPAGAGQGGGERGAGGPRQGGGFGGFAGGQRPTPEQMEQFRQMRAQGGGGFPGGMGMPGGMGGQGRQQTRRGTVMVHLGDGVLEPRQVVIGVTDRVHGQVLEGLNEGEEVVVGRRDTSTAAGAAAVPAQNNQNNNFRGQGGFPGGGNFRPF